MRLFGKRGIWSKVYSGFEIGWLFCLNSVQNGNQYWNILFILWYLNVYAYCPLKYSVFTALGDGACQHRQTDWNILTFSSWLTHLTWIASSPRTPPLKIESILLCFQNSRLWEAISYSGFAMMAVGLQLNSGNCTSWRLEFEVGGEVEAPKGQKVGRSVLKL